MPGPMTARDYWRVALPLSVAQILLSVYFISDATIGPLLIWLWLVPQGAWAIYWWSHRTNTSTE